MWLADTVIRCPVIARDESSTPVTLSIFTWAPSRAGSQTAAVSRSSKQTTCSIMSFPAILLPPRIRLQLPGDVTHRYFAPSVCRAYLDLELRLASQVVCCLKKKCFSYIAKKSVGNWFLLWSEKVSHDGVPFAWALCLQFNELSPRSSPRLRILLCCIQYKILMKRNHTASSHPTPCVAVAAWSRMYSLRCLLEGLNFVMLSVNCLPQSQVA